MHPGDDMDVPQPIHFGGTGPSALFLHGNGFQPSAYEELCTELAETMAVHTLAMRPLWPGVGEPQRRLRWRHLADDLIATLSRIGPQIIVGHSLGATVAMMAVARRPDLCRALVLIEPALVQSYIPIGLSVLPRWVADVGGPSGSTRRRKHVWPDRGAVLDHIGRNPVYAELRGAPLERLVEHLVRPTDDGQLTLAFPRAWEAHFYATPPWYLPYLARLRSPLVALRGGTDTMFLGQRQWRKLRLLHPRAYTREWPDAGHLMPLSHPERTAEAIREGLAATAGI